VKYESEADWLVKTDYLRCNPMFYGRPRYDFLILDLPEPRGRIFAKLVTAFVCRVDEHDCQFVLVQALEKKIREPMREVDRGLSIHRWNIRARNRCEVFPLAYVVRGAVLVADTSYAGDYFVIDTLDRDMFLRVNSSSF
jgi:hypothetical protein